jgi:hypothetical protein
MQKLLASTRWPGARDLVRDPRQGMPWLLYYFIHRGLVPKLEAVCPMERWNGGTVGTGSPSKVQKNSELRFIEWTQHTTCTGSERGYPSIGC